MQKESPPGTGNQFDNSVMKPRDRDIFATVGKVAMEKLESLRSKMRDDTATAEDRLHASILEEIAALACNRVSVTENEAERYNGAPVWVERTSESHFPHIRLHGGALEDDPIA